MAQVSIYLTFFYCALYKLNLKCMLLKFIVAAQFSDTRRSLLQVRLTFPEKVSGSDNS